MKSDCSVRLRTLAVFSAILCMCSVGVVAIDESADAVEEPDSGVHINPGGDGGDIDLGNDSSVIGSGTEDDPFVLSSEDLVGSIVDLLSPFLPLINNESDVYFTFPKGTEVDLYGDDYDSYYVGDPGSLLMDVDGFLFGIADTDFSIDSNLTNYDLFITLYFIAVEPELGSEQNPYTGEATIPLQNGDEVWAKVGTSVHFDQDAAYDFTGYEGSGLSQEGFILEGTLTTPGEYIIAYGNPGSDAYHLMFTLHVVGDVVLEFLSDPTDPLYATITYSKP